MDDRDARINDAFQDAYNDLCAQGIEKMLATPLDILLFKMARKIYARAQSDKVRQDRLEAMPEPAYHGSPPSSPPAHVEFRNGILKIDGQSVIAADRPKPVMVGS